MTTKDHLKNLQKIQEKTAALIIILKYLVLYFLWQVILKLFLLDTDCPYWTRASE